MGCFRSATCRSTAPVPISSLLGWPVREAETPSRTQG